MTMIDTDMKYDTVMKQRIEWRFCAAQRAKRANILQARGASGHAGYVIEQLCVYYEANVAVIEK